MDVKRYLIIGVCVLLIGSAFTVAISSPYSAEEDEASELDHEGGEVEDEKEPKDTEEEDSFIEDRYSSQDRWEKDFEIRYDSLSRDVGDILSREEKNTDLTAYPHESSDLKLEGTISENLTSREPIRIDSDDDFYSQATDENWSGNGTENDPLVIEGYDIEGGGEGHSIYIGNVSLHFTVKDCFLYNASGDTREYFENTGLYLYNTTHGRLENNTLENNTQGIMTRASENTTIIDNEVYGDQQSYTSSAQTEYSKDSILVKLKTDNEIRDIQRRENMLKKKSSKLTEVMEGRTSKVFPSVGASEIEIEEDVDVERLAELISTSPEVEYAEPDYRYDLMNIPNDPGYDSLWGMESIDSPGAWNISTGSEDVVLAVMDTGIDYTHPDLQDNMWTSVEGYHGYNAMNGSNHPMDEYGHGTHVAGTVGAVGDNREGVAGVNWNVSIMGVKIGGASGIKTSDIIDGLEYVLQKKREGENIVATSNSWGGSGESRLLKEAIAEHRDEGILFTAAAGNDGVDNDLSPTYPANYDLTNIISVGATDQNDDFTDFSSYGSRSVHVAAPGLDINSTMPGGEYREMSGTSMATPHVSGLIALLASENPGYTPNQLKNAVISSTDERDALKDDLLADGRINANKTLQAEPDPASINLRAHRPLKRVMRGRKTTIMVSLDDGVDPIPTADVTAEISSTGKTIDLKDDGSGPDQVAADGYYTAEWYTRVPGNVTLNITASIGGEKTSEEISVNVVGNPGINLFNSSEEDVLNNEVSDHDFGISLSRSSKVVIQSNNLTGNSIGYDLYQSNDNDLSRNTAWNNSMGIYSEESNENDIFDNDILKNTNGIIFLKSTNHTVIDNDLDGNREGMIMQGGEQHAVDGNNFTDIEVGFIIYESDHNTLSNNEITGDGESSGVLLYGSSSNDLTDNTLFEHEIGVVTLLSNDNSISENQFIYNRMAISLGLLSFFPGPSHENEISNNVVKYGELGIVVFSSDNNAVIGNEVRDNKAWSIISIGSTKNHIENNFAENISIIESSTHTMIDNTLEEGVVVIGPEMEHWNTHRIDTSNMVNGDPVYYLKNATDQTVPSDAGQIILANSTKMTIENQEISSVIPAVLLGFSDDNTISDNKFKDNDIGMFLWNSNNSVISGTTVEDNRYGIEIQNSTGNLIYRNKFINNQNHAFDAGTNDWNHEYQVNGEIMGGNYWDNHTEPDNHSGPDQDQNGSDGIVDDPFAIGGGDNVDDYPWTNPRFDPSHIEISDPDPANGEDTAQLNTTLSVHIEADMYPTEVEFYLDGSEVYSDSIDNDGMVETDPLDLESGVTYEWNVSASNDDGANKTVTPVYTFTTVDTYTLDLDIEGEGSIDVIGDEVIETIDEEQSLELEKGREIKLKAEPQDRWMFNVWKGTTETTDKELNITMDEDKQLTAHFEQKPNLIIRVEDENGDPIEGATVEVDGVEKETDERGEAVFESLKPGNYEYEVRYEGHKTVNDTIEMSDQEETVTVTVGSDDGGIPGFTAILFVSALIVSTALYWKKEK
ncbi:MAG: S8 family serine peptidase [Thermoplasmata archaeon]